MSLDSRCPLVFSLDNTYNYDVLAAELKWSSGGVLGLEREENYDRI